MSRITTAEELQQLDIDVLDYLAFGVVDETVIDASPEQLCVRYPGDLDNAEYARDAGGPGWAESVSLEEPIDISVARRGEWAIEDGHHRYTAAKARGANLRARVEVKGNPVITLLAALVQEGFNQTPQPDNNNLAP